MKITQTNTEVTIVFEKDSAEYKYGFLPLLEIASTVNAEMPDFADEFKLKLKEASPEEQMAKHWDDMFIKFTGACMDELITDNADFAGLISNFYNQIGEAMGPVSYAGFTLRRWFQVNYPNDIKYQDWVDDCIHYYEQSEFVK